MNRRSFLATCGTGFAALSTGCLSGSSLPILGKPETVVTTVSTDRAGNLIGYDELDCNVSQEESRATPASAVIFGDGDGEHWVYLLLDNDGLVEVDVAVSVDSETIHEETVELGGNRYTSYEFTTAADYTIRVATSEGQATLSVDESAIAPSDGNSGSLSGQTFCIAPDGDVGEQTWS